MALVNVTNIVSDLLANLMDEAEDGRGGIIRVKTLESVRSDGGCCLTSAWAFHILRYRYYYLLLPDRRAVKWL